MDKTIWYIHPYAGGPGLATFYRPYFLSAAWLQAGARATVFCSAWHHLMPSTVRRTEVENLEGVPYVFVPASEYVGNGLGRLRNMFGFCRNLLVRSREYERLAGRPDMIIASSPHPYCLLPAWLLAKKWRARLVFEVRDIWPLSLVELAGLSPRHPLAVLTGWIEKFAYRVADDVVSLLPGALEHMRQLGLAPERFHYIPNGVRLADDDGAETSEGGGDAPALACARRLLAAGKFVVVYPGSLGPPNNMLPLLEAAAILRDAGNGDICFVVMGQGGERTMLEDRIRSLGLEDFHLFSQAERKVSRDLMRLASAGYVSVRRLPIYRYGISFNKLFEYMELRLPVLLAADVPGNPVLAAACGLVTSPDDPRAIAESLVRLAGLPQAERQAMGERGREFVLAHHDYAVLARKYLALLAAP